MNGIKFQIVYVYVAPAGEEVLWEFLGGDVALGP